MPKLSQSHQINNYFDIGGFTNSLYQQATNLSQDKFIKYLSKKLSKLLHSDNYFFATCNSKEFLLDFPNFGLHQITVNKINTKVCNKAILSIDKKSIYIIQKRKYNQQLVDFFIVSLKNNTQEIMQLIEFLMPVISGSLQLNIKQHIPLDFTNKTAIVNKNGDIYLCGVDFLQNFSIASNVSNEIKLILRGGGRFW